MDAEWRVPDDASLPLKSLGKRLLADPAVRQALVAERLLPGHAAKTEPLPTEISPSLRAALDTLGVNEIYSHQAEAIRAALAGRDVLQVTPTASGKSLGFMVPIMDALVRGEEGRSLLLFPTKALAQDQLAGARRLAELAGVQGLIETYDGDTPPGLRRAVELGGHVVLTNPDMLHAALLPHHTKWAKFFADLRYVVIDELHVYRGVFGSHVANVLRRLFRLAAHYGSHPILLMASATVANPAELARRLTGREPLVIDESGAPQGDRLVAIVNPPELIAGTNTRPAPFGLAVDVAAAGLREGVPTILFVKSRRMVELAYRRLAEKVPGVKVAPYRGGYLPNERRRIEAGLRSGEIKGVVTTNALELGVDIGQLDLAVLAGLPPSIASTWQQMGRAGRRQMASMSVIVAGSEPRDQYMARHSDLFFGSPVESALVNPENLHVLLAHLGASAFELPFSPGETFGESGDLETLLAFLADGGVLRQAGGRYFFVQASFPAKDISLRTGAESNVVIVDVNAGGRPIGEVDRPSAPTLLHDQAIYMHMGRTYEVLRLDLEENKAYVRPTEATYMTDANLAVAVNVLREDATKQSGRGVISLGDVRLTWLATIFKKIHLETGENLGWGRIALPEDTMHTRGTWLTLPDEALEAVPADSRSGALSGAGHALHGVVPILTMTALQDVGVSSEVRSPFTGHPTVFLYDRVPGGIGLAEQVYRQGTELIAMANALVRECPCDSGCPSCVGGEGLKADASRLLASLT